MQITLFIGQNSKTHEKALKSSLRICFCFFADVKTREDIGKRKRKVENDGSAFLHFWIRSNIFRNFSGCRCSILISEKILRFVFPLAFQCRILNYSTAKTRIDIANRKQKTMVRLFFIFWIRSNIFRDFSAVGVRF